MTKILMTDQQRRARLVARQHLAKTGVDVVSTVRDSVVLHASDPVTPVLALWARVPGFLEDHFESAMYEDRSLWRLHAMRRTLFIAASDEAAMLDAAVGRKVAAAERKRLTGWIAGADTEVDVPAALADLREQVLVALSRGKGKYTTDLAEVVPGIAQTIKVGNGKWAQDTPISTRLLYVLAMEGDLVRGRPKGSWRGSQFRWERTNSWFGDQLGVLEPAVDEEAARATLAARYLRAYGPVMRDDLKWWTGWTVPQTMQAFADNGAVEVQLHRREIGWVLPDDLELIDDEDKGVVTMLPGLDPTPMAYKQRRFLVGPHAEPLFDDTGNIGPTVCLDGKMIGGWAVRDNGRVAVELLEDVGDEATEAVTSEAQRLTSWLQGAPIKPRFPSHLEKKLRSEEL